MSDTKKVGRPKVQPKKYRPFSHARLFAHRQQLKTSKQWHDFAKTDKCPNDIPSYPDRVYGPTVWKGWADFLGIRPPDPPAPTPTIVPYEQARDIVRPLGLKSKAEYKAKFDELFKGLPTPLSRDPYMYYRDAWKGWCDYLGVKYLKKSPRPWQKPPTRPQRVQTYRPYKAPTPRRIFRPYLEAVKFVSKLGLRDRPEWIKWRKTYKHNDIPWVPEDYYKEWQGWSIFLGHDPLPGLLENVSVLYVAKDPNEPGNVYHVDIHPLGKSDLVHMAARDGLKVLRMWKYEPELRDEVRSAIDANCSGWYGSDKVYIVPNIFGLFSDLFNILMPVV